jgi:hypothetical protein
LAQGTFFQFPLAKLDEELYLEYVTNI